METVLVLGHQLNRRIASLRRRKPGQVRVLLIESQRLLRARRWHRQRLHLHVAAMRRFAQELAAQGFEVDHHRAPGLREGIEAHLDAFSPDALIAMEPSRFGAAERLVRRGVKLVPNDQFLRHPGEFRDWAGRRGSLRMETFYRWQRTRHGILMDARRRSRTPTASCGGWSPGECEGGPAPVHRARPRLRPAAP